MYSGKFYFIKDQFYNDFPDDNLMENKEGKHDRPSCFVFTDKENSEILWCVPMSSKVAKYEKEFLKKLAKYNKCNTISFGDV